MKAKMTRYGVLIAAFVALAVWIGVLTTPDKKLHLIACDVGQGDAILATYGDIQILTDGGGNNRVLDCLGRHMPFWDRTIELVILTHPDKDHFKGLIEVVRRYEVGNFLSNGLKSGSLEYQVLTNEVGGRGIRTTTAVEGLRLRAGKIWLDILSPAQMQTGDSSGEITEKNEYSVVSVLSLGNFNALLAGDMENETTDAVADKLSARGKETIEYVKVPHHGSKNGLTEKLLAVTMPKLAVISVGNNPYGHPREEVLKLLEDWNVKTLRTDGMGDIEVVSDGESWQVK